jgi:hypothetical protein
MRIKVDDRDSAIDRMNGSKDGKDYGMVPTECNNTRVGFTVQRDWGKALTSD